jgi:hypothetical protein
MIIFIMSELHVCLLAVLDSRCGNASTALRIAFVLQLSSSSLGSGGLHTRGIACWTFHTGSSASDFASFLSHHQIDVILALHALHCAPLLQGCWLLVLDLRRTATDRPFGIIFGGTDVNEYSKTPELHHTMDGVLRRARSLCAVIMGFHLSALCAPSLSRCGPLLSRSGLILSETFNSFLKVVPCVHL